MQFDSIVFERRGDESRAHRVRGVAARKAEGARMLAHHPIDRVRVHSPAHPIGPAFVLERPKYRSIHALAVPGAFQICPQARGRLRVDGKRASRRPPLRMTRSESKPRF